MNDPIFLSDLEQLTQKGEALPELPQKIWRKKIPSFEKKAFKVSLGLHVGIFLLAILNQKVPGLFSWFTSGDDATGEIRSAIRVEVVDLPKLTLQEMKNVDVLDDVGEQGQDDEKVDGGDKEKVMTLKEKGKDSKDDKAKGAAQKRLEELRNKLAADARRREIIEKIASKKRGREALGGNILSEGYNLSGDVATAIDAYVGKATGHLRQHWNVPAWMNASTLSAKVVLKVAPDGRILSHEFTKKSGNLEFDKEVMRTLEASNPLPPPPGNLKTRFLEEGIECAFPQ